MGEDTSRPAIGAFMAGLKQRYPKASDQDLVSFYDELQASAGDETKVSAALTKLNTKTGAGATGQAPATASTRVPDQVDTPTDLPNPMRGTTQALRNPNNPQASGLSQFDPEQMKSVQADYNARQAGNQRNRLNSNVLSSLASGFDGGAGMTRNGAVYDQMDKELADQTLGAQKRLQEQATAGQAAMTSQQAQDMNVGKYKSEQARAAVDTSGARADSIMKNLGAEQQQRMADSKSPETNVLKQMIVAQAATLPPAAGAALRKVLSENPNASAMQLLPVIGQYAPALQKSYTEMLTGQGTQQTTRQTAANANLAETGAGNAEGISQATGLPGRSVATPVQQSRDTDSLAILKQELGDIQKRHIANGGKENDPKFLADVASIMREIRVVEGKAGNPVPKIDVAPMTVTGIGGNGIPTIQATPGALEQGAERAKIKQNYETVVGPAIQGVLQMLDTGSESGMGSKSMAKFLPGATQKELLTRLAQIENATPGVLPPEMSKMLTRDQSGRSFAGQLDPSMSSDQLRRLLTDLKTRTEATVNYDPKSPAKSFQTPTAPVKMGTVRMTDGKRVFNIPASEADDARKDGLKDAK